MAHPSHPLRLNAVLADPDIQTRMRLKQATTAVPKFGETMQVNTLDEAANRLNGETRIDIVFLSYRYSLEEVNKFVESARTTKQGDTAAYVLVLRSKDQDNSTVASSMMLGIDGFLFEPYSVDSLVEMTELATRVRVEREEMKQKVAATLVTDDIITQLDLVAFLKSCGYSVGKSWEKFTHLCNTFRKMSPEVDSPTFDAFSKRFLEAPLPKKVFETKSYGGVSSRVRKRMESKILKEVEKFETKDPSARILHK